MKRSGTFSATHEPPRTMLKTDARLSLAFLTATACSVYVVESFILRGLPIPFIRLGLSNTVILYLLYQNRFWEALLVNLVKPVIGGLITLNLASPSLLLSLSGGLTAIITMRLLLIRDIGFSIYGVSVIGALTHNLVQLSIVRHLIIKTTEIWYLLPLMLGMSLIGGLIIAFITVELEFYLSRKLVDRVNE